MSDDLTPAGEFVRERYATPDAERSETDPLRNPDGWVPCAREHEPGRICLLSDGHDSHG
jgi:hypothetical protein